VVFIKIIENVFPAIKPDLNKVLDIWEEFLYGLDNQLKMLIVIVLV
jgi:hypothetical protein